MSQEHQHQFGSESTGIKNDKHESYLAETSFAGYTEKSDWLLGVTYQSNVYSSDTFPVFDYSYEVLGIFTQIDYQVSDDFTTSMSARLDEHSDFGTQFSPRVSFLYRPNDITIRGSYGEGYFAPTPFVEEIEAAGLSRLAPINGLQEEQAQTASLDVTYRFEDIETSLTLFGSNVENVTRLEAINGDTGSSASSVRLVNAEGESKIRGSEVLLRYYWNDLKLTASYLYLDATEQTPNAQGRRELALTPQHSAGFVAMWEQHGKFMVGFEAYYTGVQRVDDNPYITHTKPYWHLGLLGQITTGRYSWFLNLENLLDVQQTDEHPLLLPSQAPSGRWTTDIWSRNDGFIANAGVRIKFGG